MTIAIGIRTPSGILLCSDSEMTAGYAKYPGQKVFTIDAEDHSNWSVGLTYCGDPERMKRVYELMMDSLYQDDFVVDEKGVRECFETSIADIRDSMRDMGESTDVLCGFAFGQENLSLFAGKNGVITKGSDFEILGAGDSSLTRYLRTLFPVARCVSDHSYRSALLVGAYMVKQAGQFVGGCDKNAQLCLIRNGYDAEILSPQRLLRVMNIIDEYSNFLENILVCSLGVELFEGLDYQAGEGMNEALASEINRLREEIQQL
jgi:hypothetical protein